MTLVLSFVNPWYALQVSDRLVTISRKKVHDSLANKTVIYRARDGIFSISYAGLAYLEGLPTDEWIAEKLWGAPFKRRGSRQSMLSFSRISHWRKIDYSLLILCKQAEEVWKKLPAAHRRSSLEITVCGWRCKRRKWSPFIVEIIKVRGSIKFRFNRVPRRWHFDASSGAPRNICGNTGIDLTNAEEKSLNTELSNFQNSKNVDKAEEIIIDVVRNVSARSPAVGPNCMSILLWRPDIKPLTRIRFLASQTHFATVVGNTKQTTLPVAYSPWLIGPASRLAASIISGGMSTTLGGIKIVFESQGATGPLSIASSQKRQPPPSC